MSDSRRRTGDAESDAASNGERAARFRGAPGKIGARRSTPGCDSHDFAKHKPGRHQVALIASKLADRMILTRVPRQFQAAGGQFVGPGR